MTRRSEGPFFNRRKRWARDVREAQEICWATIRGCIYEDWTKHGAAVLAKVRSNSPSSYLRVVASLIPKDVIVQGTLSEFDNLTNVQLVELLQEEARSLLEE